MRAAHRNMVKASTPVLEQSCPACGGLFTIGSASRRKKVRCPQCREVVSLAEPGALNGTREAEAGRESPAAPDWRARCEMLQARIETLEQQVEALMVTPRTRSPLLPECRHDFSPVPDGGEIFPAEMAADEAALREVFARKFQPPTPEIGLLVAAGNGAARRLAETLVEILSRAGWTVRGVTEDEALTGGCRGLILAADPTLALHRITSTLHALREAGFAMTLQLDPDRGLSETVLIVGGGAGVENETVPES